MAPVDELTAAVRAEHRKVRDILLELLDAFQDRDSVRITTLLERMAELAGPHLRYEEESLYPALMPIFGEGFFDQLMDEHDRTIGITVALADLAGKERLSDTDVHVGSRLVREILLHVARCDGLGLLIECLPANTVEAVIETREAALEADVGLIAWAQQIRGRSFPLP